MGALGGPLGWAELPGRGCVMGSESTQGGCRTDFSASPTLNKASYKPGDRAACSTILDFWDCGRAACAV